MRRDATRATRARPSVGTASRAVRAVMDVDGEVDALVDAVRRLGDVDAGGTCKASRADGERRDARARNDSLRRARLTARCRAIARRR